MKTAQFSCCNFLVPIPKKCHCSGSCLATFTRIEIFLHNHIKLEYINAADFTRLVCAEVHLYQHTEMGPSHTLRPENSDLRLERERATLLMAHCRLQLFSHDPALYVRRCSFLMIQLSVRRCSFLMTYLSDLTILFLTFLSHFALSLVLSERE